MSQTKKEPSFSSAPVALASDLDGTLTLGGKRLTKELTEALLRVKGGGTKLILATGRCTSEALEIVGHGVFDAMVAENGAVLVANGLKQTLAPPGWPKVREKLLPHLGAGCEEVIISADSGKLAIARQVAPRQARIELNKDRLMVIPRGVDKGRGLLAVLSILGLPPERTACVGDGENDASMFDAVGIRVALENSVDELKRKADFVTANGAGEGAMEAIGKLFPRLLTGERGGAESK